MHFIQNKYTKWYMSIIDRAKARTLNHNTYSESHHIIPKSLGGENSSNNIVELLAREHFICHLLLTKMVEKKNKQKMFFALLMMTAKSKNHSRTYHINSRIFENIRTELSESMKGYWTDEMRKKKSESMRGDKNPFYNKHHSAETISKLKSKKVSEENKERISKMAKERFLNQPGTFTGKKHTEETKKRMRVPKTEEQKLHQSKVMKGKYLGRIPHNKNKSYEELYGDVKANELREKIKHVGEKNGFFGKQHSPEQREKKRQEKLAAPKLKCYYCSKEIDPMNYARWHGEKCKHKK